MKDSDLQSQADEKDNSSSGPTSAPSPSSSSIEITTHTQLSLLYRVIRLLIRPIRPRLVQAPKTPYPLGSPRLTAPKKRNVEITESKCEGVWMYTLHAKHGTVIEGWAKAEGQNEGVDGDVRPPPESEGTRTPTKLKNPNRKPSRRTNGRKQRVYYFNGGGFQGPPSGEHWRFLAQLAHDLAGSGSSVTFPGTMRPTDPLRDAEVELVLVSYPLAPANRARESLGILRKWFAKILDQARENGEKVSLMGDSSGGNIALSLGFWAVEEYSQQEQHRQRRRQEDRDDDEADEDAKEQEQGKENDPDTDRRKSEDRENSGGMKPWDSGTKSDSNMPAVMAQEKDKDLSQDTTSTLFPLASIVCISPAVDMRNTNPDIPAADALDPILTMELTTRVAKIWTGNLDPAPKSESNSNRNDDDSKTGTENPTSTSRPQTPTPLSDPSVSPLLNPPSAFTSLRTSHVHIHGIIGTHDVLAPDARQFMEKCAAHGVRGRWLIWEGQMHCFPLAGGGERIGVREGRVARGFVEGVLRADARWDWDGDGKGEGEGGGDGKGD